jgi:putative phosphoesterase
MSRHRFRVGLISDTHGMLRSEAVEALRGSDFIVHAGDIGHIGIIEQLAKLAPVSAVRGNNDNGAWAAKLPETEVLNVGEVYICIVHDLAQLDLDPAAANFKVVVSGHSHRPGFEERNGVLYVNPGSAGPRRFTLPVSVGELVVSGLSIRPQLFTLRGGA